MKTIAISLLGAFALSSISCQTTYDANGNPRQSVDPGVAVAGVAAAGVLGYALSRDRNRNSYHNGYNSRRNNGYYDRRGNYRRY